MENNGELNRKIYSVRNLHTVQEILLTSAHIFADRPAFKVKHKKGGEYHDITYRQFKEDVDAFGTYLISKGLDGKKIGLIGANSYQWTVAYFAILSGVGILVPLDKDLKKDEINNLAKRANIAALVHTKKYSEYIEDLDFELWVKTTVYQDASKAEDPQYMLWMIEEGKKLLKQGNTDFIDKKTEPDAFASLLFTSGTTGTPKGVMLSNENLVFSVLAPSRIVDIKEGDVSLSILPAHHTFESTINMLTIFFQGGSIAFCEGLKYVLKNIQEAGVSVMVGVPLIVESIYSRIWKQARAGKKDKILKRLIKLNRRLMALGIDKRRTLFKSVYDKFGGRLRLFIVGAAAIEPNASRGFMDLGFDLCQGYGLTETAPLISGVPEFERKQAYKKAGSCGPVVPYGEIKINAPDADGIGEIIYRGPNVMLGYYEMPEETENVIKDGWFYTGDLGFLDKEGWLYITGRSKNVIVTKTGKNIYPEELEVLINQIPEVKESMVYAKEEDGGNDYIVAVQILPEMEIIVENMGKDLSEKEIFEMFTEKINEINNSLPNYKRVRNIQVREKDFIRTTTKKIKRQANL